MPDSSHENEKANAPEARQPLYVLWWVTLHMRWWDEEEIISLARQGKLTREVYKDIARFHALRARYGGLEGGRVRRDSDGQVQVQERSVIGARSRPVVRICTTEYPRHS
jgi:hypothetical protein